MKHTDLNETLHRAIEARTAQIKSDLFRWIRRTSGPEDALPMTAAFLEMAIEGHLAMNDGDAATQRFLASTLERIVQKPSGCP
jgi:hypothetical protein